MKNLGYCKRLVLDKCPILPRVIAGRIADEYLKQSLPFEIYVLRIAAFENFAEKIFVRHYNTSEAFRRDISRLRDQDDLISIIYPWFDMWWHRYEYLIFRAKQRRGRNK